LSNNDQEQEAQGRIVSTQGGAYFEGNVAAGGDVFGGDKITYGGPLPVITSLHQLPPPPADFTGREEELDELTDAISQGNAVVSGIWGMGGVGKTALALKLAQQLTPQYPDAQLYLDLQGTSDSLLAPSQAMAHVVRAYYPTARLPESEAELAGLYRSVLHNQRALLLMDNAVNREQVEPLLCSDCCVLLVTSRTRFTLPGLKALNLDTLPPEDAQALLLKIAPRIDGRAGEMAELCGCLPLALRLAGGVLAERENLSTADYLRLLQDTQTRLDLVDASLSVSYDLLDENFQRLWCILAVFPGTFDRAAAAVVWQMEQDPAQDALDELVRYSLVEWDAESERYRLHDLARLYATTQCPAQDTFAAEHRHAAYYLHALAAADDLCLEGGEDILRGLALFDLERHNIEAGQAWASAHAASDEDAARLCSAYPDMGAYCLDIRLHRQKWIHWLSAAIRVCQALGDRIDEGAHLGNLGSAYAHLGHVEKAIEHYEQALAISREIREASAHGSPEWTDAHQGEANHLGNLGFAYYSLGQMERAIAYSEQALDISHEIREASTKASPEWTEARRGEGTALGNLGNAYSALGEVARAIAHCEQALAIAREIGDRHNECSWVSNLGNAYRNLGQVERAIVHYEQALAIAREIGDQRGEGVVLGNLGNAYGALAKDAAGVERASAHYEQALAIAQEIGDRRSEGNWLGNLGNAYSALGEAARAIDCHERALAIAQEIRDRRGEGAHLANLGNAYAAIRQVDRAIEYMAAALAVFDEVKSPYADQTRRLLAILRQQASEQ
jgi:tetratricopeptide (TPR) repeat protein